MAQESICDFTVKDNKGNDISLAQYKGKVMLIVNTATACGFTPQYSELESLYETYADKGLEILDFPCNQFGAQAPGTDEEIQEFCTINFNTRFARFKKIEVNGENELPLYTYLKSQKGFAGFDPAHPLTSILDGMFSKADPDYAKNPKSLLGRFWHWHINFCPGWKGYFTSLDAEAQQALREKYDFKKY